MNVAEKLKLCRKSKNLTQEQLANQLYVSRKTISSWETGRNYPDINSLIKMSKIFDVSMDDLLRDDRMLNHYAAQERQLTKSHKLDRYSYYFGAMMLALSYVNLFRVGGFHLEIIPMILVANAVILAFNYSEWHRFNISRILIMLGVLCMSLLTNGIIIGLSPNLQKTFAVTNTARTIGRFTGNVVLTIILLISMTLIIFLRPRHN